MKNVIKFYDYFIDKIPTRILHTISSIGLRRKFVDEGNFIDKQEHIKSSIFGIYEYLPYDLYTFLNENYNTMPLNNLLSICIGIGNGLQYLLDNHIAHRSVTLKNISVDETGRVVINNFEKSARLEDDNTLRVGVGVGDHPIKDTVNAAPELIKSYKRQRLIQRLGTPEGFGQRNYYVYPKEPEVITLDYSKQPSFEFGMICYEILFNLHKPFKKYRPELYYLEEYTSEKFIFSEPQFDRTHFGLSHQLDGILIQDLCNLLSEKPEERPLVELVVSHMLALQ